MDKKKLIAALAVWALFVLLTLLLFFVIIDNYTKVRIIGLVYILIALTLGLAVFISADFVGRKAERVMYNAGMFSVTGIFLVLTVLFSLIFMVANRGEKWLGLIGGILLILFAILLVLFLYMSNSLATRNREVLNAMASVKGLEIAILSLKNDPVNKDFKPRLEKLYDAAKYCDSTVFSATDQKISGMIEDLKAVLKTEQEDKSDKVNCQIDDILTLYKTRAEEIKALKSGSF